MAKPTGDDLIVITPIMQRIVLDSVQRGVPLSDTLGAIADHARRHQIRLSFSLAHRLAELYEKLVLEAPR